ncbi:hypothetical protein HNY73_011307 [Argiope bruennichi]|uniref:Uncharacterized protein n=1 Tax=Argiope bruennichi TaxID=94029 RepID=A0A8T0F5W4_ARGBR|nr:hypothetical protein HNY73_011307 [Argiope bruennichi]
MLSPTCSPARYSNGGAVPAGYRLFQRVDWDFSRLRKPARGSDVRTLDRHSAVRPVPDPERVPRLLFSGPPERQDESRLQFESGWFLSRRRRGFHAVVPRRQQQ